MILLRKALVSASLLLTLSGHGLAQSPPPQLKQIVLPEGVGTPSVFLKNFETFKSNQLASKEPDGLTIPLGFVGGHSRSFFGDAGSVSLNLKTGAYSVIINKLVSGTAYHVRFINEGELEDSGDDRTFLLASSPATNGSLKFEGLLGDKSLDFPIDKVVVTESRTPDKIVASGSMSVLQKVYFGSAAITIQEQRVSDGLLTARPLAFAWLVPDIAFQTTSAESASLPESARVLRPTASTNSETLTSLPIDALVKQGSKLFFEGTFRGNGRTCGTCHPAHNNFTIDTAFISSLPRSDPLFIAENNRALRGLEKPALMRRFGLILANLDGLENPTGKFVMRSVPHALGMTVSIAPDTNLPNPPAHMTGWSGDGAPGTGSARDFATGAVIQHFPRTLARIPGQDFVLPTARELDALEAFQLSLGRNTEFDLAKLKFQDANVETGKKIFIDGTGNPAAGGRCNACHTNGGALNGDGLNRNFNTNVEDVFHPARKVENYPIDGGFGVTPNSDGSFGNRTFNTSSLVEVADTPPFFHNNIAATLEDAVKFYTRPEFNDSRALTSRFSFTPNQVKQVSNFLRGLNTLQNIDIARRALAENLRSGTSSIDLTGDVQSRLATAFNELGDVIEVLGQTNIFPAARTQVVTARQMVERAQQRSLSSGRRGALIQSIVTTLDSARRQVATSL